MFKMWQFCKAKEGHHHFLARNQLNLIKVGVTKHEVGRSNSRVGEAAATPTIGIGNSARAVKAAWHWYLYCDCWICAAERRDFFMEVARTCNRTASPFLYALPKRLGRVKSKGPI